MTRLPATIALVFVLGTTITGCNKTCEKLRTRVCDDDAYLRQNKRHCELMQEEERFANLSPATCKSILNHISSR